MAVKLDEKTIKTIIALLLITGVILLAIYLALTGERGRGGGATSKG